MIVHITRKVYYELTPMCQEIVKTMVGSYGMDLSDLTEIVIGQRSIWFTRLLKSPGGQRYVVNDEVAREFIRHDLRPII